MKRLFLSLAVISCITITAFSASTELNGVTFTSSAVVTSAANGIINFDTSLPLVWCRHAEPRAFYRHDYEAGLYQETKVYSTNPITVSPSTVGSVSSSIITGVTAPMSRMYNGTLGNFTSNSAIATEYTANFDIKEFIYYFYRKGLLTRPDGYIRGEDDIWFHAVSASDEAVDIKWSSLGNSIQDYITSERDYVCQLCGATRFQRSLDPDHFGRYIGPTLKYPSGLFFSKGNSGYLDRNNNKGIDMAKEYIRDTTAHQVSRTYYQFQSSGIDSGTITSSISNGTLGLNPNWTIKN